ncbi:hypothetical protein HHK36_031424 (mitochondrion) [Tetracentron sinense]|uniref:Uncharacterized protein n=1 Tax=Tetracentron sinense TaxID=13715 RepID=A0A835D1E4_TETSI|nr:hypothetical protein LWB77_mgp04 [Tetracentron sinense]KAF8364969.1 hypothetical protein HHK36_033064 [Tetracentron sinense]KAF8376903.1 hypothetical protein HHK36_031424 [Tetracentron sinense]
MALFLFLLFVSGPVSFFLKAYPGAAALGHPIPLLSFAADLTSRAAPSCSGSSDERSSPDSEKSVKREATLDSPLSLKKKPLPRGEQKLQDEYVLDSRIHSRPDPPWNFRNLQKHSRRGLVMIFSKITRC